MKQMPIELLSPAGSPDALRAAVDCGANAVYLGFTRFGARATASNFDAETLAEAVRYAHLYHVRIYTTVNILVKPNETDDLYRTLEIISACGADSAIVQDIGVANIVRRFFPRLALHASTQMAICNAEQAEFVKSQGFSRVVLARECGLNEVAAVSQTGIETEVFVHGALCTAVSGRCLMSSAIGGRSGNRGRCAQPCRQFYSVGNHSGALLSMRDLCLLRDLPAVKQAGACSLKLEGRLKSPEYVAVVTSIYRHALDDLESGNFDAERLSDIESLKQIFNRGGFTRGHLLGAEDSDLICEKNVSHEGVQIGTVEAVRGKMADLRIQKTLHSDDSLQIRGNKVFETRYSGPEVKAGGLAHLYLRPDMQISKGMTVARLADSLQLVQSRLHKPKAIPLTMHLDAQIGKPIRLTVTDRENQICVTGGIVQKANTAASNPSEMIRQLRKLGNTPFCADEQNIEVSADPNVFAAVSEINALRRSSVEQLTEERCRSFAEERITRSVQPAEYSFRREVCDLSNTTLAVIFRSADAAESLRSAGADLLVYDPFEWSEKGISQIPENCWLRIPPQLSQDSTAWLIRFLEKNARKWNGLWTESIGWLHLPISLPLIAGESIPVCNQPAMDFITDQGVSAFCFWPEWSAEEQRMLLSTPIPVFRKVYGRDSLMLLNHCPKRVQSGFHQRRDLCTLCKTPSEVCAETNPMLIDRKGYAFPLIRTRMAEGCEITVLNAMPTDLRPILRKQDWLDAIPLIRFTTESLDEMKEITHSAVLSRKGIAEPVRGNRSTSTAAYWLRGVE